MKAHEIVAPWRGHPQFPTIAKRAATLNHAGSNVDEIVAQVTTEYGDPTLRDGLRDEAAPHTIYGIVGVDIEEAAVAQLRTALRLPIAIRGALMPDAHPGYALPVGGVVAYHRAVAPYQVGVDIGCRMHLSVFRDGFTHGLARDNRLHLLNILRSVTVFGVGGNQRGIDHPILQDERWQATSLLRGLHKKATQQIGTSGGGNHFAEVVLGEWQAERAQFVGLLTHSGSRGVGSTIASHYAKLAEQETKRIADVPKTYEWLDLDSEPGQEYMHAMRLAGDFAKANHEVIHERFAGVLDLQPVVTIQNHHNFAWVEGDEVVHRKGATPAEYGEIGIIPGSMATASYIVRGLGNPDSLQSASHGAGRVGSRTKAKATINREEMERQLAEADVLVEGFALDESPAAYKDIETVMRYQVDARLIEPVARMRPLAVLMAGSQGED